MGSLTFLPTIIEGLFVIEPRIFNDNRGCFFEAYNQKKFAALGIGCGFVQDNQSVSKKGVLRGLHFQMSKPQAKLVRVLFGEVFDVAVDLRKESSTFGKWFGIRLSDENKKQLYIPGGFAHGFLALSETAVLLYKCSDFYYPQYESGVIWNDKDLSIKWPIEDICEPALSEKDIKLKRLCEISDPV